MKDLAEAQKDLSTTGNRVGVEARSGPEETSTEQQEADPNLTKSLKKKILAGDVQRPPHSGST